MTWGNNLSSPSFRAHIFSIDPLNPGTPKSGQTAAGIPSGTQTYGGALLSGTGFSAGLFAGPPGSREEQLILVDHTSLRSGVGAGLVNTRSIILQGLRPGERATFQVRAWESQGGFLTTWANVINAQVPYGKSELVQPAQPLGGVDGGGRVFSDLVITGWTSFSLFNPPTNPVNMAPVFTKMPESQVALLNSSAFLGADVAGTRPISLQWRRNGAALPGQTNVELAFQYVQYSHAGSYTALASNAVNVTVSSTATLQVVPVLTFGNGQRLLSSNYTFDGYVDISFASGYPGGLTFYTLNGSEPSYESLEYVAPFRITNDAIVRAIVYNEDLLETGLSQPVRITVVPAFALNVNNAGGGAVTLSPPGGSYLSNSLVTLTAAPEPGWTFLGWSGDIASSLNPVSLRMDRAKCVQAVFGTTVATTAAGNGTVKVEPPVEFYPFGGTVTLSAMPESGSHFALWGNAGSGTNNPLLFQVTSPNPVISSLFVGLGTNEFALAALSEGRGRVAVNPQRSRYVSGTTVTLTATPEAEQVFLGWSGDVVDANNPLVLTMDSSRVVTANFSRRPRMSVATCNGTADPNKFALLVSGSAGERYELQVSSNLESWSTLTVLSNAFGVAPFIATNGSGNTPRFYRALLVP